MGLKDEKEADGGGVRSRGQSAQHWGTDKINRMGRLGRRSATDGVRQSDRIIERGRFSGGQSNLEVGREPCA